MDTTSRNRFVVIVVLVVALLVAALVFWKYSGGTKLKGQIVPSRERNAAAYRARMQRQNQRGPTVKKVTTHPAAAPVSANCPVAWTCTADTTNGQCVQHKAPDSAVWGNVCGTTSCRGRCYR